MNYCSTIENRTELRSRRIDDLDARRIDDRRVSSRWIVGGESTILSCTNLLISSIPPILSLLLLLLLQLLLLLLPLIPLPSPIPGVPGGTMPIGVEEWVGGGGRESVGCVGGVGGAGCVGCVGCVVYVEGAKDVGGGGDRPCPCPCPNDCFFIWPDPDDPASWSSLIYFSTTSHLSNAANSWN